MNKYIKSESKSNAINELEDIIKSRYGNDIDSFRDEILIIMRNDRQIHDLIKSTRTKPYAGPYQALIQCCNELYNMVNETEGKSYTSSQVQTALRELGIDFKELLAPLTQEVIEDRESMKQNKTETVLYGRMEPDKIVPDAYVDIKDTDDGFEVKSGIADHTSLGGGKYKQIPEHRVTDLYKQVKALAKELGVKVSDKLKLSGAQQYDELIPEYNQLNKQDVEDLRPFANRKDLTRKELDQILDITGRRDASGSSERQLRYRGGGDFSKLQNIIRELEQHLDALQDMKLKDTDDDYYGIEKIYINENKEVKTEEEQNVFMFEANCSATVNDPDVYGAKSALIDEISALKEKDTDIVSISVGDILVSQLSDKCIFNFDCTAMVKGQDVDLARDTFLNNMIIVQSGLISEITVGDIEETSKVTEAKGKILKTEADDEVHTIWSSEIDYYDDSMQQEVRENDYQDYLDSLEDGEEPQSFEDYYEDLINNGFFEVYSEDIADDLDENILPMIDKQLEDDVLLISGYYSSNYADFRPSGNGGVLFENGTEGLREYLTRFDDIEITREPSELGIRCADHDGSVSGRLYTLPKGKDKIELLRAMGYEDIVREDYDEEDIEKYGMDDLMETEFSDSLYYGGVEARDFNNVIDKLVPVVYSE